MYIPWRRQLPVIFNRKTRQVTCLLSGEVRSRDWDDIEAYVKDVVAPTNSGPANEGMLSLVMYYRKGWFNPHKGVSVTIPATETFPAISGHSGDYGAMMIWEYIRLYMEKGPAALPSFADNREPFKALTKYRLDRASEVFTNNQALREVLHMFPLVFSIPLFLVVLPFNLVGKLAELVYLALDYILPRRKWPKGLLEACDYVWDGSNDLGPRSEDA
jgi:hypothetical protein